VFSSLPLIALDTLGSRMGVGPLKNHGLTVDDADRLLEPIVEFENGLLFERIRPITDFRKDDTEARILYICRRLDPDTQTGGGLGQADNKDDLFILKCKVQ
jgi:hypothetical protein